ncbi:hypothetical protein ACFL27_06740 [candidate division CSSED10-310 bacterium]|uniref:Uncharacterized protein n=1 Tax=candidate division CSSED10-310 bacterium TaxID=2855610 RepID=A0ABV6YUL4_UNCC1
MIIINLSRRHTRLSLRELGAYFGGVSYGTMAWICRQCRETVTTNDDSELSAIIGTIEPLMSRS